MQFLPDRPLVLTQHNVVQYLQKRKLIPDSTSTKFAISACSSKNFNLVVKSRSTDHFLVKQEKGASQDNLHGDFCDEWKVYQLMTNFPELEELIRLTSEVVDYVPEDGIIIAKFYDAYSDAYQFYSNTEDYPEQIAALIAHALANIHKKTYQVLQYRNFLGVSSEASLRTPNFQGQFYRLKPEVYGVFSLDAIRFFKIIQQQAALKSALEDLQAQWQPLCLIHRDLKFDNILLHKDWSTLVTKDLEAGALLKIIDWECFTWGDPTYDLATIVGCYLQLWLRNLHISPGFSLQDSLNLVTPSLNQLRPSLVNFLHQYAVTCPEIVHARPHFWQTVLKFAGYYLLERLIHRLSQHSPFDNQGVCTLQVAKRLLCDTNLSCKSILGMELDDLSQLSMNYQVTSA